MRNDVARSIEQAMPPSGGPVTPDPAADRRTDRNTSRHAMIALKAAHSEDRTVIQRIADSLIRLASSTWFLVLHGLWFVTWIAWNTGALGLEPFDPFPFGLLTMVVSLEAIFLAIFVLMAQSREAAIAELREELMLQVNLRMEAEVTKTLQLVAGLFTRLGYQVAEDEELRAMLKALDASSLERELMEQIRKS
ncbi:MAG TPA: DUF1003 domain-containing protein [Longimicrobiales bacterium]|nr:DUF1003 domain-containing protein [Longimicrobiales bacterium]